MIRYDTLLDAAAQHLERVAGSPNHTRAARNHAAALAREVRAELALYNAGEPTRELIDLFQAAA